MISQSGAQYQYGMLWLSGRGVAKQDEAEAVKWLKRAAELGHPEAMFNLGVGLSSQLLGQ